MQMSKANKDSNSRIRELSNNNVQRKPKLGDIDDRKKKIVKKDEMKMTTCPSNNNLFNKNTAHHNNILSLSQNLPSSSSQSASGNIRVVCRFRPLNDREKEITKDTCVEFIDEELVEMKSRGENNTYQFSFDRIFRPHTTQKEIYESTAKPIVDSVLEGFNGTIFAYGQTSSGKTYTMEGVLDNHEKEGIIPRMIRHVFHHILCSNSDIEYTVKVAMMEIYMEKIRDLIDTSKTNLIVRTDKSKDIFIENLSEHYVANEDDMMGYIRCGRDNRTVAATNCNDSSSRSHSIFIMTIHQNNIKDLVAKTGKLYLVDLAGSEKITKTGVTGITLEEAKMINKSLTCLGRVINSLTDGKSKYVPYRESKLTRVLQESLGGNAKTSLIIACSPSSYNESETLSTLRFGMRAKKIKNKPKINKEVTVAELKMEIDKLERLLLICNNRILQLEKFIVRNNLIVPVDSDISFNKDTSAFSTEKSKRGGFTIEAEINLMGQLNEGLTTEEPHNHGGDLIEMISSNHRAKSENEGDLNDTKIEQFNETKIKEIADKYTGIVNKMTSMEEEKKDLHDKLEDALAKIADLQASLELKEKIEDELESIKATHQKTLVQLKEKIAMLNEKAEIERNKIVTPTIIGIEEAFNKLKDFFTDSHNISLSYQELNHSFVHILDKITHARDNDNRSNICTYTRPEKKINSDINGDKDISTSMSLTMDESVKNERRLYENEKKLLLKNLQENKEKLAASEAEQQELRERIKLLEAIMTPDDKNYVKKIMTLEKNLEQVNMMYHQVVTQKSVLKIENQVMEKKINKRNEKIMTLDKENFDLKEQLKMRDDKLAFYQKSYIKNVGGPQLVKVLRGGKQETGMSSNLNGENQIQSVNTPTPDNNICTGYKVRI